MGKDVDHPRKIQKNAQAMILGLAKLYLSRIIEEAKDLQIDRLVAEGQLEVITYDLTFRPRKKLKKLAMKTL